MPKNESNEIRLRVEGMTCGGCVSRVEDALRKVHNVQGVSVNLATQSAIITWESKKPTRTDLINAIRNIGYDAEAQRPGDDLFSGFQRTQDSNVHQHKQATIHAIMLAVPVIVLHWLAPLLVSTDEGATLWPRVIQGLLCFWLLGSAGGAPILVGGLKAIIYRVPNMDLLLSMGVIVAFLSSTVSLFIPSLNISHFHAAAMILLITNFGRFIEARMRRKASSAITNLMNKIPEEANLVESDQIKKIKVSEISLNQILLVSTEQKIPVDGHVINGQAAVDMSMLTGESTPIAVTIDDKVLAGCIVVEGEISIKATSIGNETRLHKIIQTIEEAQSSKTMLQKQQIK